MYPVLRVGLDYSYVLVYHATNRSGSDELLAAHQAARAYLVDCGYQEGPGDFFNRSGVSVRLAINNVTRRAGQPPTATAFTLEFVVETSLKPILDLTEQISLKPTIIFRKRGKILDISGLGRLKRSKISK